MIKVFDFELILTAKTMFRYNYVSSVPYSSYYLAGSMKIGINQFKLARIIFRGANFSAIFNQTRCFLCLDGSMVIPRLKVCDNVIDCSDLSDECLCEGKIPEVCNGITSKSRLLTSPS